MRDKQKIIEENERRLGLFTSEYNPVTGKGSLETREAVRFSDMFSEIHLPVEMLKNTFLAKLVESGNMHDFAKVNKMTFVDVFALYMRIRFSFDFEFWAKTNIKLQHKEKFTSFEFVLRFAQRILLHELEKMRLTDVPIRLVLLKARQWGGSTLVQMYMFWIQQIHKINWHLAVCAQDDGAANNISEMYRRAAKDYPEEIAKISFKPYARSPKNIVNVERGGIIGVGSINNPDQFRSYNYAMIHFSEPGIWEDTPKRTAKGLVSSLRSVLPDQPLTLEVLESTAKGVGSFFHDEWVSAESESSGYKAVFIPWFKIDMYLQKPQNYSNFIDGLDAHDWFMWDEGATLDGINWYNNYKSDKNYDDWMMNNEFPTTAEEAFVSSGQRYFAPKLIIDARKNVLKPNFVGTIHPTDVKDKAGLEESNFVKNPKGPLEIWKMPRPIVKIDGKLMHVLNRYCVFGDIGGTTDKADYSSLTVLDRMPMFYGGWPELAADWHGHLDQDLFSWVGAQLAWLYDKALFAIETNSLRKEKSSGDHFLTVLDNIKDHYDNLYIRNEFERIDKEWVPKYGFHTNTGTKDMILSCLRAGLRDHQYVERQKGACDEMDWYERKEDGKLGAIEGKNDDKVITRAGAYWLAIKYMPAVTMIPFVTAEERKANRRNRRGPISEAVI